MIDNYQNMGLFFDKGAASISLKYRIKGQKQKYSLLVLNIDASWQHGYDWLKDQVPSTGYSREIADEYTKSLADLCGLFLKEFSKYEWGVSNENKLDIRCLINKRSEYLTILEKFISYFA